MPRWECTPYEQALVSVKRVEMTMRKTMVADKIRSRLIIPEDAIVDIVPETRARLVVTYLKQGRETRLTCGIKGMRPEVRASVRRWLESRIAVEALSNS